MVVIYTLLIQLRVYNKISILFYSTWFYSTAIEFYLYVIDKSTLACLQMQLKSRLSRTVKLSSRSARENVCYKTFIFHTMHFKREKRRVRCTRGKRRCIAAQRNAMQCEVSHAIAIQRLQVRRPRASVTNRRHWIQSLSSYVRTRCTLRRLFYYRGVENNANLNHRESKHFESTYRKFRKFTSLYHAVYIEKSMYYRQWLEKYN